MNFWEILSVETGNHAELAMGIMKIISQSEGLSVLMYIPIFLGNTFLWKSHTQLAMGILENELETDLCSDKIFCEFHFCVFKTFFYRVTKYIFITRN